MAKNSYIGTLEEFWKSCPTQILLLSWTYYPGLNICVWYYPGLLCFSLVNPGKIMQFDSFVLGCLCCYPLQRPTGRSWTAISCTVCCYIHYHYMATWGYLGTNISPRPRPGRLGKSLTEVRGRYFSMSLALLRWRSSQTMPNYGPLKRPHLVGRIENMGMLPCASMCPAFLKRLYVGKFRSFHCFFSEIRWEKKTWGFFQLDLEGERFLWDSLFWEWKSLNFWWVE